MMSTSVSKIAAERNHRVLLELVSKPGNDVCADCKARAPRWASLNLGIFICVNCASIHRKIGTHVTKVKSITLDEWSKEQVEAMKENGNVKSNALYNPNEARHPPPTNMTDSERDSELERFIRSKYEFRRFMDRKSGFSSQHFHVSSVRSRSTPLTDSVKIERRSSPGPPLPPKTPENMPLALRYSATIPSLSNGAPLPARSVSQPHLSASSSERLSAVSLGQPAGQVWEDLISLQAPSQSSSLPLQYSPAAPVIPFSSHLQVPVQSISLDYAHATAPLVASPVSISTPGSQFPFVPPAPLSSPGLHLGTTNPFNQAFSAAHTGVNTSAFSTSPFSSSMTLSAPTTPSLQPIAALPTGMLSTPTPPLGYVPLTSQTPTLSLPLTPFSPPTNMTGMAPYLSYAPPVVGATTTTTPGQVPMPHPAGSGIATNSFSAVQLGQRPGFPGALAPPSGTVIEATTTVLTQQQRQQQLGSTHAFGAWAGHGMPGTF